MSTQTVDFMQSVSKRLPSFKNFDNPKLAEEKFIEVRDRFSGLVNAFCASLPEEAEIMDSAPKNSHAQENVTMVLEIEDEAGDIENAIISYTDSVGTHMTEEDQDRLFTIVEDKIISPLSEAVNRLQDVVYVIQNGGDVTRDLVMTALVSV